jgi:hypothetical protein
MDINNDDHKIELDHLLLLDIDGLRADVFARAFQQGRLPNISRLLGGPKMTHGLQLPALSTAPSITFTAQASLFTGAHPREHGIAGNQFFDRFGDNPGGKPGFFAFDVGDTLQLDDAIMVFTHNLAGAQLQVPTLYERLATRGKTAVVAGNMYANGAAWLKPSLPKLGRFLKGGQLFGKPPEAYDRHILGKLLKYLGGQGVPDIITLYLMGLDFVSHKNGPAAQADYLINHIDPKIGELWDALCAKKPSLPGKTLVAFFSDHGQIPLIDDDRHALKLGFPFDREMARFFDAIGLDVHDFPNEAPNCNAVLALNGGLAHVYIHHHSETWQTPPDFAQDILPVGRAFWEAHETGRHSTDMQGTLSGVLVRNVQEAGWNAPFQALSPQGERLSLADWFDQRPSSLYADPVNRLNQFAGRHAGDLLLISNYAEQFYFGKENKGGHGGLHPEDSLATMSFAWPGLPPAQWAAIQEQIQNAVTQRCQREGGRQPSVVDLVTGITAVTDQFWS